MAGTIRIVKNNDNERNTKSSNSLLHMLLGLIVVMLWSILVHLRENGLSSSNNQIPSASSMSNAVEYQQRTDIDGYYLPLSESERQKIVDKQVDVAQTAIRNKYTSTGPTVISSFLKDETTLRILSNPEVWKDCKVHGARWLDANVDVINDSNNDNDNRIMKNVWEKLAKSIWDGRKETDGIVGYEYWCHILSKKNEMAKLEWHVDKDEDYFTVSGGKLRQPTMGAVYYGYPHKFRGGYLEMVNESPDGLNPYLTGGEIERIRAEYNRLVILNVSNWHRVTELTNDGARYAFAVNIWHEKPLGY